MLLLPCDIVLVRHKGAFLSEAIRLGEHHFLPKAVASHTGLITAPGDGLDATITEALMHVVEHRLADEYQDPGVELCIFRPVSLTDEQKDAIVAKARSFIGDGYGYLKIGAHLLDDCLGGIYLFRRLCRVNSRPICSYVVASAFAAERLDFGVPLYAASPDDIWDFCVSHPAKYQMIWQRGTMFEG